MASNRARIALLLVGLVALAGCTGGGGLGTNVGGGGAGGADMAAQSAADGGAGGGSYYENGERVIIREASMEIEVREFDPAFSEVRRIARANGGFVADWDHTIERGWHSATLVVRVPAGNFSATRDDLAGLGDLERENVRAQDFTNQYRDLGARLEDLRAEERELDRILENASRSEEALELHDRLSEVRERIRELEAERSRIERREALSTIRVTIHEPPGKRPPKNYQAAFGFDDAFLDALYGGLTVLKYAIVAIGYAIPIGITAIVVGTFGVACFRVWGIFRARLDAILPRTSLREPGGETGRETGRENERQDRDQAEERSDGE